MSGKNLMIAVVIAAIVAAAAYFAMAGYQTSEPSPSPVAPAEPKS
jgi:hypothetical protein